MWANKKPRHIVRGFECAGRLVGEVEGGGGDAGDGGLGGGGG
jgi:hypothetical protein